MYSTILLRKVQENKSIKCSDTNLVFKIFKIWLCTFKVYNSLRVIFHQPKFYVSLIFSFYIIITKAEIYMLQRKKEVFILFFILCAFCFKNGVLHLVNSIHLLNAYATSHLLQFYIVWLDFLFLCAVSYKISLHFSFARSDMVKLF